jgi:hypothetical protein
VDAYKRGKILESKERAECAKCERPKRESEGLLRATTLLSGAAVCESWELSLSEVILLHVLCCNPFSISKYYGLFRGCRRFCRITLNIVSQCA